VEDPGVLLMSRRLLFRFTRFQVSTDNTRTELLEIASDLCLEYGEACDDDRVVEIDACDHLRKLLLLRWTVTLSVAQTRTTMPAPCGRG
jgi:hypothetical protein